MPGIMGGAAHGGATTSVANGSAALLLCGLVGALLITAWRRRGKASGAMPADASARECSVQKASGVCQASATVLPQSSDSFSKA